MSANVVTQAKAIVMSAEIDLYFPVADEEYEVSHMKNAELASSLEFGDTLLAVRQQFPGLQIEQARNTALIWCIWITGLILVSAS